MTKKLMLSAAISALMLSGAFAQSPTPSSPSPTPPAASPSTPPGPDTSAKPDFVMAQKPDQHLASKFQGTDVLGSDGKKVGDVSDILFDKTGKIEAYVISVGGFLGMGAKEVALAPAAFVVVAGENGGADKLKISMTNDQIKQAQNFARYEPPRATTTGAGPGGMRPSTNTAPSR